MLNMELVFTCKLMGGTFLSAHYEIIDYRGVVVESGRKRLDMHIRLSDPCPFCGEFHSYAADELGCPLSSPANEDASER